MLKRFAAMILLKKDVLQTAGLLQVCGERVAGYEGAIHAMHGIFNDNNTEGILLMDRPFIYSIQRLCFTI